MKAQWHLAPALLVPAALSAPAYAVTYYSVAQAQQALFPQANAFVADTLRLTPAQQAQIGKAAGTPQVTAEQPIWRAMANGRQIGWFIEDEVIGKHELITYAVALDMTGAVQGVEILTYRESRGGEIRNPRWLAQFQGKHFSDPVTLGRDIANISGATYSCRHIAEGVKRILALYEAALK